MADTLVTFDIGSGSGGTTGPSTVYVRPVADLASGQRLVVPGYEAIPLDPETGQGQETFLPNHVYEFVISVPSHTTDPEWRMIPESTASLGFVDLLKVARPPEGGDILPTWVDAVLDAYNSAQEVLAALADGREDIEELIARAEAAAALVAAPRYNVTVAGGVATFQASQFVTPSADGKTLRIHGGVVTDGYAVPRLVSGKVLQEQLPVDTIVDQAVTEALLAMPAGLTLTQVRAAIDADLSDPASALRVKLGSLYGGSSGGGPSPISQDVDGVPYVVALGV
jgi:hypothetical protein